MQVRGGKEWAAKMEKVARSADMMAWIEAACLRVRGYAQRMRFRAAPTSPPVSGILTHRAGGAGLRGAINYEVSRTFALSAANRDYIGKIGVPRQSDAAKYAQIHEEGGRIPARNKPYLTFRTFDGQWHRVKSVLLRPRPYLEPSLKAQKENIVRDYRAVVWKACKEAGVV